MSDCLKASNRTRKVQQLQRTLYLKSKQEKEIRFYSLYDKICREDVLWEAWRQVKLNRGAPGIDGVAIKEILAKEGREQEIIDCIQEQLREKCYQFMPVRRVDIPKPKGGTRPLGIATIADRIVQTAMKIVLEPIFEADFHKCSYGYRPKRSAKQASLAIKDDLYDRVWGVVEIDFQAYFTSISHGKLYKLIRKRIADGSMMRLIRQTLKVGEAYGGKVTISKRGVAQGSPISPLYSNIYLNLIDQLWHKLGYPEKLGATLWRYADDAILVCRKSAQEALEAFTAIAQRMELTLNNEKTQITKLNKGFEFLGFHFVKRKSISKGKNTIYIFPAKRSQQKVRDKLRSLTSRRAPITSKAFIMEIKPVMMGWVNYYRHTNASNAFNGLQNFVNKRFRRYLTYIKKSRGFGWKQYPNSKLYAMGMPYICGSLTK